MNHVSGIGRLTKLKKALLDIFSCHCCLLSKEEIVKRLKRKRLEPDRTTLYRELLSMTEKRLIHKSTIAGTDYYEMPQDHHHHLICVGCKKIEHVEMGHHLEAQEKKIAKEKQFDIINHSLEFFGYCRKCQS